LPGPHTDRAQTELAKGNDSNLFCNDVLLRTIGGPTGRPVKKNQRCWRGGEKRKTKLVAGGIPSSRQMAPKFFMISEVAGLKTGEGAPVREPPVFRQGRGRTGKRKGVGGHHVSVKGHGNWGPSQH